jgi:hypothetical protein
VTLEADRETAPTALAAHVAGVLATRQKKILVSGLLLTLGIASR